MPVVIGLLFHANFPFSIHFNFAYHSCYKHLPKIMREFPDIPINWHLSATLLQQLAWNGCEVLNTINEGLNEQQFEILGSSYAQNVLYACSEWANHHHIKWNCEIISNLFPQIKELNGFWNPERVFYASIPVILREHGYKYTLVENCILQNSLPEIQEDANRVWKLKNSGGDLFILPDNQTMKNMTNDVIWSGKTKKFFKYLDDNNDSDSEKRILCYAEDAEATGFWQFARGMDYKKAHTNLRRLLRELEDNDWIEIKLFSDIINTEPSSDIAYIKEGQASWMAESVKVDGYKDWFDYVTNAPEISYYKHHHSDFEKKYKLLTKTQRQRNLAKELLCSFLSQQFEFGCSPGSFGDLASRYLMNVPGYQIWDDRVTIDTLLDWLNSDGVYDCVPRWILRGSTPVIEWETLNWIGQYSSFGGRCTVLLDKSTDSIVSPNIFFPSQDRITIYNSFPHLDYELKYLDSGFSSHTHGNLFEDDCCVDGVPIGSQKEIAVQLDPRSRKYIYGKSLRHTHYSTLVIPHRKAIQFWYWESNILVKKEIKQYDNNIEAVYTIRNDLNKKREFEFRVTNEFSPCPIVVLDNGKASLSMKISENADEKNVIVRNKITDSKVKLRYNENQSQIKELPAQFAKRFQILYRFELDYKEKKKIIIIVS